MTGSQGERDSALWRLSTGEHPAASLERGDRVVMSARVIPGNERKVLDVLEAFAERGVEIVDGHKGPHVSGHGYAHARRVLADALRGAYRHQFVDRRFAPNFVFGPEEVVVEAPVVATGLRFDGQTRNSSGLGSPAAWMRSGWEFMAVSGLAAVL